MKYLFFVTLYVCIIGCKTQKEKMQPLADSVKDYFATHISDIKNLDTIYIIVDIMTPHQKGLTQAAEYRWAWTQAKESGNADSSVLKQRADSALDLAEKLDNTTFLCYRARNLAIYHTHDSKLATADKWLYFDKHLSPISKYSFITKAASTDNEDLLIDEYIPFSNEQFNNFHKIGGLIYY